MKKLSFFPFASMSIGFFLILGCENAKETIGLTKQSPDEFAVVTRAPLSIPPKFDLRPPKPGADRPQETATRSEARKILLKNTKLSANKTHKFKNTLMKKEKINHIKINIFPDGGISRFKIFGKKI